MPTENPSDRFPDLHDTLKPMDRLLIQSANVIDMIGVHRDGKDMPVFDANWDDDKTGRRFALQEHRDDGLFSQRKYFLRVYEQFKHDAPLELYRYSSLVQRLDACDEEWNKVKVNESTSCTASRVSKYLASAIEIREDENDVFLHLMDENEVHDPRVVPTLRRLGRDVLKKLF